jgi:hypothetical protein
MVSQGPSTPQTRSRGNANITDTMLVLETAMDVGALLVLIEQCIVSVVLNPRPVLLCSVLNVCRRYGNKVRHGCKNYHHASDEAQGYLVAIEHNWTQMEILITFINNVLPTDYVEMQGKVLAQLRDRLRNATALLDGLIGGQAQPRTHEDSNILSRMEGLAVMSPYRKFKYGTKKGALKEIVDDLEKWQSRYNPIWLLLVLIKSPRIDEALSRRTTAHQQNAIIAIAKTLRDTVVSAQEDSVSI